MLGAYTGLLNNPMKIACGQTDIYLIGTRRYGCVRGKRGTTRSNPELCNALRLVFDTAVSPKHIPRALPSATMVQAFGLAWKAATRRMLI